MRLRDDKRDCSIDSATLLLTRGEAQELADSIRGLLAGGERRHEHVSSDNFQKEITIAIYDHSNVSEFDARCQRLIRDDT